MADDRWRDEDRWRRSDEDRWRTGGERDYDYGRSGREDWRGWSRREDYGRSGRDYERDYDYGRGGRGSYGGEYRGGSYGGPGGYGGYGSYGGYGGWGREGYGASGGYEGQGRTGWAGDYYRGDVGRWGQEDYSRSYGRGREDYGRGREERGLWDRASDEVRSWFGDEDAERRRRMDELRAEHRGRGPRGYRRSDDRIREDINDRLTDDPYLDASDIEVSVNNGEVTLSGTVDSRTSKRRAEDIAERVLGVTHVQNNLRVRETASTWGATTATGTTAAGDTTTGTTTGTTTSGYSTASGSSNKL